MIGSQSNRPVVWMKSDHLKRLVDAGDPFDGAMAWGEQLHPDFEPLYARPANARLIAAAPDLLEASDPDTLDVAAEQCRRRGLAALSTALTIMADRQRAAIAKATGEGA